MQVALSPTMINRIRKGFLEPCSIQYTRRRFLGVDCNRELLTRMGWLIVTVAQHPWQQSHSAVLRLSRGWQSDVHLGRLIAVQSIRQFACDCRG